KRKILVIEPASVKNDDGSGNLLLTVAIPPIVQFANNGASFNQVFTRGLGLNGLLFTAGSGRCFREEDRDGGKKDGNTDMRVVHARLRFSIPQEKPPVLR